MDDLQQFTELVLPLIDFERAKNGGAQHIFRTVRPFLWLMALNIANFLLLYITLKLSLRAMNLLVTGLNSGLLRLNRAARNRFSRTKQSEGQAKERSSGKIVEEDAWESASDHSWCGKDWTQQDAGNEAHDALCEAFNTLGLKPSASEEEIRSAYRRLIKRYHPDLYMKASPTEQARVNHIIVRVRHAYDLLTREGTNLH